VETRQCSLYIPSIFTAASNAGGFFIYTALVLTKNKPLLLSHLKAKGVVL
jgi:hypothetical protein